MSTLNAYKAWFDSIPVDNTYDVKLEFAVKLENALADSGMTKKDLAKKINKSQAWISKVLRGDANLTIDTMCELTRAIECHLHLHIAPQKVNVRWFDTYKSWNVLNDRKAVEAWKSIEGTKNGKKVPVAA